MKSRVIKLLISLMLAQGNFGCAHYFSSVSSGIFFHDIKPLSICIVEGEVLVGEGLSQIRSEVREDVKKKVLDKALRKYSNLINDCTVKDKYLIVFKEAQERVKGDYFILSLGVIPFIANTSYEVDVLFDGKSVYKATDQGKAVMSVFFIPFFFLHKSESDILYDLLNGFLQKNSEVQKS